MKTDDATLWTIDELRERVAVALGQPGYRGVASGRVRDVPDLRTIRYYTTLGLLDRPAEMRGRTAFYANRHLLQLVAIKRLQAQGMSLAAVQERVVGLSDRALGQLADTDSTAAPAEAEAVATAHAAAESRAESFWCVQPAPVFEIEAPEKPLDEASPRVQEVPLEGGLVLSVAAARRILNDDDLRVIRMASAPLVEILKLRGLIAAGTSRPTEGDAR